MDRRRRRRDDANDGGDDDRKPAAVPDGHDVIDLVDLDDESSSEEESNGGGFVHVVSSPPRRRRRDNASATSRYRPSGGGSVDRNGGAHQQRKGEWSCPRCTLKNSQSRTTCEACLYECGTTNSSSTSVAAAAAAAAGSGANGNGEAIIEDIDDEPPQWQQWGYAASAAAGSSSTTTPPRNPRGEEPSSASSSPAAYVGGGALLGSMIGAANAYVHGRPLGPAAIEGAFAGGIGGAVMNEVMAPASSAGGGGNTSSGRRGAEQQQQQQRSAAAAAYGSTTSSARAREAAAAPSNVDNFHIRRRGNGGLTGTYSYGYSYRAGGRPPPDAAASAGMNALLRSLVGPPGYIGYADVDNMSYEQLLARYGDGTENQNRGATAGQIASLPTSVVNNAEQELPADHRQCSICLEKFEDGDKRKTLPCLHGFHDACIDRWLDTNASCPVCKHEIIDT
mmetsp:Transcript_14879/g.33216  ORF Transcript_14879/g.33216 Transcript_14879/m.33216 type:complete len:450 (-) Transcript_14879:1439-2788(-)